MNQKKSQYTREDFYTTAEQKIRDKVWKVIHELPAGERATIGAVYTLTLGTKVLADYSDGLRDNHH